MTSPLIVSLGEILIDFTLRPSQRGRAYLAQPGGGPMNVAVAARRLGGRVAFAGGVSRDHFGRWLRQSLEVEGVDTRFLIDVDGPSTLAFAEAGPTGETFSFYGESAADTRLTLADLPAEFFAETAALHFGGISLIQGSTPDAAIAAVERLKPRALISLDPNIRPNCVIDEPRYRARLARAIALADLLKLSDADLAWLERRDPANFPLADQLDAARGRLARDGGAGPVVVALTRGAAGSVSLTADYQVEAPAHPVEVVDTVGAGDTYLAAYLVGLIERGVAGRQALRHIAARDLGAVGRFAAIAAALVAQTAGADPPRRRQVDALL